ncbi:hypothetical protein PC116_g16416 [Phytophthora cactorum]|nr:hypothetical protein Pcac1_g5407 [Phytophthora cactorum]KAG4235454.1 hypothetical protein PC116_g16416 [Phytophthora cactorum]
MVEGSVYQRDWRAEIKAEGIEKNGQEDPGGAVFWSWNGKVPDDNGGHGAKVGLNCDYRNGVSVELYRDRSTGGDSTISKMGPWNALPMQSMEAEKPEYLQPSLASTSPQVELMITIYPVVVDAAINWT